MEELTKVMEQILLELKGINENLQSLNDKVEAINGMEERQTDLYDLWYVTNKLNDNMIQLFDNE